MRIRDRGITKVRNRATAGLLCLIRSRNADASNLLAALFMRQVQYDTVEEALYMERLLQVRRYQFNLEALDDAICLKRFRFLKKDIYRIVNILSWPTSMNSTRRRRYRTNAVLSFCLLCRRLGTVSRWWDLEEEFGMMASELNEIFYEALEFMFKRFSKVITEYKDQFIQERAEMYAGCVKGAGAPLDSCIAFIDGTNLYIARPKGREQRATYSGHKRRNCVKFQAISLPDGLIFNIFGPVEGRRHDMTLYRRSNIAADLERSLLIGGRQFYIYGDPAYVLRAYLQTGFQGSALSQEQKDFNKLMSAVRIAVEWAFKDVKKYFTHVDSPRKLGLRRTPAGLWYHVAVILWNMCTCLYGSQSASFFNCTPPSLETYLTEMGALPAE